MNKLKKVFYGCYQNYGWGEQSSRETDVKGRPYMYSVGGPTRLYEWDSYTQTFPVKSTAYRGIVTGGSANFSWRNILPENIHIDSNWTHYAISDTDLTLAFNKGLESKVVGATLYLIMSTVYRGDGWTTSEWKWVLNKLPLHKSGTVALSDGVHDAWVANNMRDARQWGAALAGAFNYTLDTTKDILFAIYPVGACYLEVEYEPNTMMNLPSENE